MLDRLQRGLEQLYRIETELEVSDFLIDKEARALMGVARAPREQLLVREEGGELSVGLFVDDRALSNLAAHDPAHRLGEHNMGDFLLALEGVSHFVYLTWRAQNDARVSALELELQAEVDKYVTCLLVADDRGRGSAALRRRLYRECVYEDDLDPDERDRYQVANDSADRYAASLERRFVAGGRIATMLEELRRFYRLPLDRKLEHIRDAA